MIRLQVGAEEVKELVAKESEKLRESAEKVKDGGRGAGRKRWSNLDLDDVFSVSRCFPHQLSVFHHSPEPEIDQGRGRRPGREAPDGS